MNAQNRYFLIKEDGSLEQVNELTESHKTEELYGILTIIRLNTKGYFEYYRDDDDWELVQYEEQY